jgi:glycosyltransferase involved in cell wall biosynthesis
MSKQIKMLALFDYNSFTGFATVSRNLVAQWSKSFGNNLAIDIIAINYFGDDYNQGENIRVISGKLKDAGKDDFGRHIFLRTIKDVDYDVIFILQDLGVVMPMVKILKEIKEEKKAANRHNFKSLYYFPVDFALTPNLVKDLDFFDFIATYTEYGRTQVLNINPNLKGKLKVIPHGSNLNDFKPTSVLDFRKEYFGSNQSKFIVSNINRNQSRKDIPTTIFGFLEYNQEYNKNSLLYLHLHPKDPMGWNIRTILSQTPLVEGVDYMLPSEEDYSKGASIEKMNLIYNASDVFLTTATGGGWELSVTEAMTCRIPVIMPKHTSFAELGGNKGERAYYLETL